MSQGFPTIDELLPDKKGAAPAADKFESAPAQFARKLEQMSLAEKEKEAQNQAAALNLPHIDLSTFPVSSEALRAVPKEQAQELGAVCFYLAPDELRLGCLEPSDAVEELLYQLGERYHAEVKLFLISEHSLERVLKLYANLPVVKPIKKEINITDEELAKFQTRIADLASLKAMFANISISDIVTLVIAAALKINASDVHVEAEERGFMVRYRIDGVLHEVANLPKEQWRRFVARIKLLAALKINIDDRPQDGRVTLKLSGGDLDVRVSTLPTIYGESVVMRILYSAGKQLSLDELGLRGRAYVTLTKEITRPNGMIVTTGPTGSGKTTTMYAILKVLNKAGVNVVTLEDPIEIRMEGINQSQVDMSKGYTFAKGLRSILRQDPDICMVGEIRDLETADTAIQAALTGHLILSTIHTNDAAGAVPRFLSMGVKPYLLAPALDTVIGQRLVRRVCERCRVEDELDSELLERVGKVIDGLPAEEKNKIDRANLKFYRGRGCRHCNGLGYAGRIGIYEVFVVDREMEEAILKGDVSEYGILDIAVKNGMLTMVQDGILKALDKITTVEEVFRVTE